MHLNITLRNMALAATFASAIMSASAYDCYLAADFTSGAIPADFTLVDADALEQSPDNAAYGFSTRDSWIISRPAGEDNYCACATSYFTTPGKASNWMISRSFTVDSADATLEWTARSVNAAMRDGYSIYISTDGNELEDFGTEPVFTIQNEVTKWTRRTLSLAPYEGKSISVAFVHDSYDCDRLCISDIFAGIPASAYLLSRTAPITGSTEPLDAVAEVYTNNETPVAGFSVTFECDGNRLRQDFPDRELKPGERFQVTFPKAITPIADETLTYTLAVEAGESVYSAEEAITCLPVRVLCEEMTGTWCGFCVSGIVMLEEMRRDFPDTFIGAAIHVNDVMSGSAWNSRVSKFIGSGLPAMVMNHDNGSSGHPRQIRDYYLSLVQRAPVASIRAYSVYDPVARTVDVTSRLLFADEADGSTFRIDYGIVENDVYHPGNPAYLQSNAYAGGENGEMGGWENLPDHVDGVHFNEVARHYVGDCDPLPASIAPLEEVLHTASFQIGDAVENPNNAELIAILFDADDKVVNVARTPLNGTDAVATRDAESQLLIRDGRIIVPDGTPVYLYTISGTLIATGRNGSLPLPATRGLYIVTTGDKTTKIII